MFVPFSTTRLISQQHRATSVASSATPVTHKQHAMSVIAVHFVIGAKRIKHATPAAAFTVVSRVSVVPVPKRITTRTITAATRKRVAVIVFFLLIFATGAHMITHVMSWGVCMVALWELTVIPTIAANVISPKSYTKEGFKN